MFVLKLIIVTSAILNIGSPAVQCGSDQVYEFQCLTPDCSITLEDDKISVGRLLILSKKNVTIVGRNEEMFLVKTQKGKTSKVYHKEIKILHLATLEHWKFKVNILKNKLQICESNNQINEENYIDPSISHTSTNTDVTQFNVNDKIDTPEVLENANQENTEQYDDKLNNETDSIHSDYDNDMDESIEIKSLDESDLDVNLVQNPSTIDSNIAINLDSEIVSTNGDQILISEKSDRANTINQKNTHKPIGDKQLENESSTECSLDSCVKELKENIVTENLSDNNNISPVLAEDSLLQNTQHSPNLDNSIEESPKYNNSDISLQDNYNNISEEFILNSSYQQENNQIQNTQQLPSEGEEINVLIKESVSSNIVLQKSNKLVGLNDNNDETKQFSVDVTQQKMNDHKPITTKSLNVETIDNIIKESINKIAPQISTIDVSVHENNSNTQELNMNQQKSEEIQTVPQLPNEGKEINVLITESVPSNKVLQKSNKVVGLNDNNDDVKQFSADVSQQKNRDHKPITTKSLNVETKDNIIKESINKIAPQISNIDVSVHENNSNTQELNMNQRKSEEIQTAPQLPNAEEKTDVSINESASNIRLNNSNPVVNNTDTEQPYKTQQEYINSDSLQNNTEADNQQVNNNNIESPLLETENIEINNENKNIMSIGDNLIDHNIITKMNEFINQPVSETKGDLPVLSNDHKEPESLDIHRDNLPNVESKISNIDSADGNITNSSSLQESNVVTEIDPSNDYKTTVVNKLDVTEILNEKSIDQCTSDECFQSIDSTPKYGYESIQHQYKSENKGLPNEFIHETVEYNNNEQLKEFVPKSFVASFGHPDACSGVNCLNFKRNAEKTIKAPQPLNPVPKHHDHPYNDKIASSINIGSKNEKENIIIEETEQSGLELSFLDYLQNWLSSPTSNTVDFVANIFSQNSKEYNDVYPDAVQNEKIEHSKSINHSELYFIVAAGVTVLFSLIYYKYQNGRYENHLLTLIAAKDQNLLIFETELLSLKELSSGNAQSNTERNTEIDVLNDHLTKLEDVISSQAIRIENLEQEIVELTENGMEMHTLLSSALESNSKNKERLNTLKEKLVDSENLIAALTKKNFEKSTELEKKNEMVKAIKINLDELTNKGICLAEDKAELSLQLEQVNTKSMAKESKLFAEIKSLQFELDQQTYALATAENEVLLSKDALKDIMSQKFNPADTKQFVSSMKLSAELKSAKQMSEEYKHKLNDALKLNQQFLDDIEVLKSDLMNLENKCSKLETMKEESVTKLNILTKFFEEKEQGYLKQINEKAVLCDNREGESSDLNERIKSLNQEIFNYKSEIQSLMKEITDQEISFKIQLSAANKKSSDNWISFRQAERKIQEIELETAQLRNKLTMVDKKLENGSKSPNSSKDFDDEMVDIPFPTVSPDFSLLALIDFEPPPPILTNQRLPPLGALGRAPSPPRRHNRSLSPSSSPPLPRSSAFRPLTQRYKYMNREKSLGHSVESLDK